MTNRAHKRARKLQERKETGPGPIHRAPWDPSYRTYCFRGTVAYELQIGSVVVQWFYAKPPEAAQHRRFHVWRDQYARRSYLQFAPWGVAE